MAYVAEYISILHFSLQNGLMHPIFLFKLEVAGNGTGEIKREPSDAEIGDRVRETTGVTQEVRNCVTLDASLVKKSFDLSHA